MISKYIIFSMVLLSLVLNANENNETKEKDGVSFRAVPTLTSNPTSGTGVGLIGIIVYQVDEESSPSQTIASAQYTDTDSYSVFLMNKMFFDTGNWQSNSVLGQIYNNSLFDVDIGIGLPDIPSNVLVNFDVDISLFFQQFLYKLKDSFYFGPQVFYIDQKFNALNDAGKAFLILSGIEDSQRVGLGFTLAYDTRSKKEIFYPTSSNWIDLAVNDFPKALGTEEHFYNVTLNARDYMKGFKSDDVFASQLYAQYSSADTPDGALSALGARNVLRGFSMGQYKTRNMVALQGEYRYQLTGTSFRFVGFGGLANMSGGSKGTAEGNRDKDNGNYYSGGVGVRYTIQKDQGIDYRVDFATTNEGENSVYASMNQAF